MLIAANQLYSYSKLSELFPQLVNINTKWLLIGLTVILVIILLIFKLLTYVDLSNNSQQQKGSGNAMMNTNSVLSLPPPKSYEEYFSFIRFLFMLIILCIVMLTPIVLLYLFNKHDLDKEALDFDKVFAFLVSYGSSFLLILFALMLVIFTLIYVWKYIYLQICSLKKISDADMRKMHQDPPYVFSVIIVCVLLFFSWRVTDFSLYDLTDVLVVGDYLVLPITVMIAIILFLLLVQIVHAIILMLSNMTAKDVKDFMERKEKKWKIGKRISKIIRNIVDIILNSILSALEFIKFVPNFFCSLSKLVLLEDEMENEILEEYEQETVSENSQRTSSDN